jgi:DNA-binding response OmpR family regulator
MAVRKKILVVEDEKALNLNLSSALSSEFEVISTASGNDGLAQAQEKKPDLILLDIMLPDKTGIEVLRELKANDKTSAIPVIVLTNMGDVETVSKILAAGGKEYLIKSDWNLDSIVDKVKETVS